MSCDIGVYNNTLAAVAAGLTFKMAVTNLLTARCRTVGYEQGRRNKEDSSNNFPLLSLFRMFLGGTCVFIIVFGVLLINDATWTILNHIYYVILYPYS